MNTNAAVLIAHAVSAMAEIEAMKVQNDVDKISNRLPTYGPDSFRNVSFNLESLIRDLR